jgi:hypothetical protein
MHNPAGTPAQTWAAAIAGSLGAHALVWGLLSQTQRAADQAQRKLPELTVYLVPPEPPPEPERSRRDLPDLSAEPTPTVPEARPPEASERETGEPVPDDVPSGDEPAPPVADSPRAWIDWNAEIAKAVVRLRPEAERYRTFGYPERPEDSNASAADSRGEARLNSPGSTETTAWGERRVWLNEHCYQSGYEPGSVLGEAHRFGNSFVICSPDSPDKARDDLFAEIKPAYLR